MITVDPLKMIDRPIQPLRPNKRFVPTQDVRDPTKALLQWDN